MSQRVEFYISQSYSTRQRKHSDFGFMEQHACLPNNFCFMTLFYVLPQVHHSTKIPQNIFSLLLAHQTTPSHRLLIKLTWESCESLRLSAMIYLRNFIPTMHYEVSKEFLTMTIQPGTWSLSLRFCLAQPKPCEPKPEPESSTHDFFSWASTWVLEFMVKIPAAPNPCFQQCFLAYFRLETFIMNALLTKQKFS